MAEIKNARFDSALLPPVNSDTGGYFVRFRVVSQDKNRKSAWSPVYSVVPDYTLVPGEIGHFASGNILSLSWDPAQLSIGESLIRNINGYDIWVNWNNLGWTYKASTSETSYNVVIPSGTSSYAVKIYRRSSNQVQLPQFEVYSIPDTVI